MSEPCIIGRGIFAWDDRERRTNRYGTFTLVDSNYENTASCEPIRDDVTGLVGKRVRLVARVLERRESGHAGDTALGIRPSTPAAGEAVWLGTGTFVFPNTEWQWVGLSPGDGRDTFWLDPRALYRLHDQTVEMTAEATDDPDHPRPLLSDASGLFDNGDGTFQVKGREFSGGFRLVPFLEPLGDGLFAIDNSKPGIS